MRRTLRIDQLFVPLAFLVAGSVAYWSSRGSEIASSVVMAAVLFLVVGWIGGHIETAIDPWLTKLLMGAFAAKIVASVARWAASIYLYDNTGDAFAYHDAGVRYAEAWRSFELPLITGRSMGTRFVERLTSLLYAPHTPHIIGGYFMFAAIGFAGQVLYYAAFRRVFGGRRLLAFGLAIFFMPALLFWPASIGKDALMTFFLGLSAYMAARLLEAFELRWIAGLGIGLWGAAVIRSHVVALFGAALLAAILIGRALRPTAGAAFRRLIVLGVGTLGALIVLTLFAETFGLGGGGDGLFAIDLRLEDLDPVISDIERRTSQGGSAIDASGSLSLLGAITAVPRVLFAPFPWQAHNPQALIAAAEGIVIFGIVLWALPSLIASIRQLRRNPYLLVAMIYVLGFSAAFSTILNLGILSRQRGQVMGMLMTVCFGAKAIRDEREAAKESPNPTGDLIAV